MKELVTPAYPVLPAINKAVTRENTVHSDKTSSTMCEVLGSQTCRQCMERRVKQSNTLHRTAAAASISSSDVAAILNIQKAYPHISEVR